MLQRLVNLTQLAERDSQVVVSQEEVWSQVQGVPETPDGLGMSAHALQGRTQITQSFGVIRLDLEGGLATIRGPLEVADGTIRLGQVRKINRGVRPQAHGLFDQFRGQPMITALMVQNPTEMQGFRVLRIALEGFPIQSVSHVEVPVLMHLDGRAECALHR